MSGSETEQKDIHPSYHSGYQKKKMDLVQAYVRMLLRTDDHMVLHQTLFPQHNDDSPW